MLLDSKDGWLKTRLIPSAYKYTLWMDLITTVGKEGRTPELYSPLEMEKKDNEGMIYYCGRLYKRGVYKTYGLIKC